jgi:hypothetical protein
MEQVTGDIQRYNFEESQLIKGYLAGTLTKQQRNKLLKMLVPTGLKKEDLQSSVLDDTQPKLPKFTHTNIKILRKKLKSL